ncbi:MAG: type IV toxin-antitoxin system AbiEi family antitoxin [Candidatus Accumulibacter sp.]|jgi:predicted transcriptional regulator of viral defense system|nr:type IV toxin-antitoxin system AbiEi family antitoxin [Accumulibacter sp.]
MLSLDDFIDERLRQGRATFTRADAENALALSEQGLVSALVRLSKRKRLASPHKGFFIILRPEDQASGAPDVAQWIDPLMRFLDLDYRVSLLRAAAFHGASHQAAMVFQVIVPRQLRTVELGRHRLQFLTQAAEPFAAVNAPKYLGRIKTIAGFAKVAGVALTLLDSMRYVEQAGGLDAVAQIVKDIGHKADPRVLRRLAAHYETTCVRRLGYLFERNGFERQAAALEPYAAKAKTAVLLAPSAKPFFKSIAVALEREPKWKLIVNENVELDF